MERAKNPASVADGEGKKKRFMKPKD